MDNNVTISAIQIIANKICRDYVWPRRIRITLPSVFIDELNVKNLKDFFWKKGLCTASSFPLSHLSTKTRHTQIKRTSMEWFAYE